MPRPATRRRTAASLSAACALVPLLVPLLATSPAHADTGSGTSVSELRDPGGGDHGGSGSGSGGGADDPTETPTATPTGTSVSGSGGDDRVEVRGSCSGSAHWKLKVKPDDGRLEVEAEVDSNRRGQSWSWKLRHNGSVTARGTGRTSGPSGSYDVERTVVDLAGPDRIAFRATYAGQVCRGVVNY